MNGIRIRTPDELQRCDVMRWHHTSIARMELIAPPKPIQLSRDCVDPLGHNEHRSFTRLGEEVAKRTIETSREHHALPILRNERKRPFESANAFHIRGQQ